MAGIINWTPTKLRYLKKDYADAIGKGMSVFKFRDQGIDHEIDTAFAEPLIDSLDNTFKKK